MHRFNYQRTLTLGTPYFSDGRDPFGPYTVTDVCIHNPENINNCELVTGGAHYCMMLLQQYELVLANICNL
jgi:hypothetical protein